MTPEDGGLADHFEVLFGHIQMARGINALLGPLAGAAGGAFTYKCDPRFYEFIHSVIFTYTADATVASRVLSVNFIGPDGQVVGVTPAIGTLTASQSAVIMLSPDNKSTLGAVPGTMAIWLPRFILKPGWSMQVTATNQGAGDLISPVYLNNMQWPSNWADGTEHHDTELLVRRLVALLEERG